MFKILILGAVAFILYVIVLPIVKFFLTIRRARRGDFSGFSDFFGQPGAQKGSHDANGQRRAGWTKASIRKKKIGKDVGEYVNFNEVCDNKSTSTDNANYTKPNFTPEQQVSDVEWEDVK